MGPARREGWFGDGIPHVGSRRFGLGACCYGSILSWVYERWRENDCNAIDVEVMIMVSELAGAHFIRLRQPRAESQGPAKAVNDLPRQSRNPAREV